MMETVWKASISDRYIYIVDRIDQEKDWADQEHLKNIIAGITSE